MLFLKFPPEDKQNNGSKKCTCVPRSLDPLAAMNNQDRISPHSINKNQAG